MITKLMKFKAIMKSQLIIVVTNLVNMKKVVVVSFINDNSDCALLDHAINLHGDTNSAKSVSFLDTVEDHFRLVTSKKA